MVNLSIRKLDSNSITKEERVFITHFERYVSTPFNLLPNLLINNFMYSIWPYEGHYRSVDTVCGKANLLVLDIDYTTISMQDRFNELVDEGFAVIVATTSDRTNIYKYRILIPLDREVTNDEYRRLVIGIRLNGLVADLDPVSSTQIFYSYKGGVVLSNYTDSTLCVNDYIANKEESKTILYDNGATELPDTFEQNYKQFFRSTPPSRSKRLMYAAHKMMDDGYSYQQVVKGVLTINNSFIYPKSNSEVHRRVLNKVQKDYK